MHPGEGNMVSPQGSDGLSHDLSRVEVLKVLK